MLNVRRIVFSTVAAAALVTVVASSAATSKHAVASSQALKIVAFGSSSTQGVGASRPSASYPSQLEMLLRQTMPGGMGGPGVDVVNRGIGGEDADDMVKRLDKDVIQRHPNLVIFQTGSNDPMRHVPLARFEQETRASIRAMQTAGIKVILMEPQWCPHLAEIGDANAYRDIVRKLGTETGASVIRRYDMMQDWVRTGRITQRDMISDDNLHMRDKGYALLARAVAAEVLRIQGVPAQGAMASAL